MDYECMESIKANLGKLPIYLQQLAGSMIASHNNKDIIGSLVMGFVLIEGISRYYVALYQYNQDPTPDDGRESSKLEYFEDILHVINSDLKIPFIKGDADSILNRMSGAYSLDQTLYDQIKSLFTTYRNKLLHGSLEGVASQVYGDERFPSVVMSLSDDSFSAEPITIRKDSIMGGYNEEIFYPIFDNLLACLDGLLISLIPVDGDNEKS